MDLIDCDQCKRRVSADLALCPHCGGRLPLFRFRRWGYFLVIVMGALALAGLACLTRLD